MFERTFSFWRRLVGKNPSAASNSAEEDRRVWARYPAQLNTNIYVNGKLEPARLPVTIRDISLGGANLTVEREFSPGTMLTLELPRSSEGNTHDVLACIVRVSKEGDNVWSIGCVFSRELTESDLEGVGAKKIRHDSKDQRIWMRFPVTMRARIQKVASPDTRHFEGQILNLSPSGIGVLLAESIDAGTLLSVDLMNNEGDAVKTILACVVHVTGHPDGQFSLGCNFIRQLHEEELRTMVPN